MFGLVDLPAVAAATVGRPRPGRLHPPHGGGRTAVRAVAAAAHDRRRPRADAQPRRRAPVRDRLRQRRPAAARRPPALRRGGQPRADRARHAAAQAPGGRARADGRNCSPQPGSATSQSSGPQFPRPSGCRTFSCLLDRWEGFTSTLGELEAGSLTEILTRLLSEGASVGMHLVMTGDRSLLLGRISSLCEEKLVFKLAEKDDYRLAGLNPRDLPDNMPPGRALPAGTGTELQVALLAPDASGQGQAAALQAIAAHCRSRDAAVPAAQRPFRVDVLPSHVSFADAWRLRPVSAGPLWGLVGVGGDTLDGARAGPRLRGALLHRGRPGQIGAVHHPAVHGEVVPRCWDTGRAGRAAAVPAAHSRRRTWRAGLVRPGGARRSRTRRSPCLVQRPRRRHGRRRGTAARLRRGQRTEPPDRPRERCRARPGPRRGRREHRRWDSAAGRSRPSAPDAAA